MGDSIALYIEAGGVALVILRPGITEKKRENKPTKREHVKQALQLIYIHNKFILFLNILFIW